MSISGTLSFKYFIGSYFLQLHTMLGNASLLSCLFNFLTLTLFLTHAIIAPDQIKADRKNGSERRQHPLNPFVLGDVIEYRK